MHAHGSWRSVVAFVLALAGLLALAAPAGATFKVEQLPGGKYAGAVKGGTSVQVQVRAQGKRGVLRIRCARIRDRFRIRDDGSFTARKRNRSGRVVLRVRGQFSNLTRVRGRVLRLSRGGPKCRQGRFVARLRNVQGVKRTKVRYGPYHVQPDDGEHGHGHGHGGESGDGDHGGHGGESGDGDHGHMHHNDDRGSGGGIEVAGNVIHHDVVKPCEDCFVIAMLPDLVDASGKSVNHATAAMLHHIVFFNMDRDDATCDGPLILDRERFFAAGNERTMLALPAGHGYRIDAGDTWLTAAHLMNMAHHPRDLSVEVTFWYVEAPARLQAVKPFWFDIDNCGNSEYMTPAGLHTERRDFLIPAELSGRVVAAGGHLHDHGIYTRLANVTRGGRTICRSAAGYGTDPAYAGHIEAMRGCVGRRLAILGQGDTVRLHSTYNSPHAQHDAMGIVVGYVAPGRR